MRIRRAGRGAGSFTRQDRFVDESAGYLDEAMAAAILVCTDRGHGGQGPCVPCLEEQIELHRPGGF